MGCDQSKCESEGWCDEFAQKQVDAAKAKEDENVIADSHLCNDNDQEAAGLLKNQAVDAGASVSSCADAKAFVKLYGFGCDDNLKDFVGENIALRSICCTACKSPPDDRNGGSGLGEEEGLGADSGEEEGLGADPDPNGDEPAPLSQIGAASKFVWLNLPGQLKKWSKQQRATGDCAQACTAAGDDGCIAYQKNEDDDSCVLFKPASELQSKKFNGLFKAKYNPGTEYVDYLPQRGQNLTWYPEISKHTNLSECQTACRANDACVGYGAYVVNSKRNCSLRKRGAVPPATMHYKIKYFNQHPARLDFGALN